MNKKLEKNKRIFNEYLDKKNHILKCEKEKYNWYLNLDFQLNIKQDMLRKII